MSDLDRTMTREEILGWLRQTDPTRLERLFQRADAVRRAHVGDLVHLRGLVEFSNHCRRKCTYCGIRAPNAAVARYRMSTEEILGCARQAVEFGYGTLVLQSGEDAGCTVEWLCGTVRAIKSQTPLAVTLSLGERSPRDLRALREAGADRYLLRFETSDRALFERIHPRAVGAGHDRIALLRALRALGFQAGSGVMTGIPGQSFGSLADDIVLFRELDLDMVGIGPFIPHPATPLGASPAQPHPDQVPSGEDIVYKAVALTRIVCPDANIPSTTALGTVNREHGREQGLQRGANVIMPNLTPAQYRARYEIYPAKASIDVTMPGTRDLFARKLAAIGRGIATGPGHREHQR